MEMIIGRSLTPLKSSRTMGNACRRDDNSRGKVQNVRGDSSANSVVKLRGMLVVWVFADHTTTATNAYERRAA
jgi:hypothetical protein